MQWQPGTASRLGGEVGVAALGGDVGGSAALVVERARGRAGDEQYARDVGVAEQRGLVERLGKTCHVRIRRVCRTTTQ